MACTCEVIRTGNIKGLKVCKECVEAGRSLSSSLKFMMAEELRQNINGLRNDMRTQVQRYEAIFKKENVN